MIMNRFTELLQRIPYVSALIIILYIVIINIVTFAIYGKDKRKARRSEWRTPESTLFILAIAGGSIGALAAMAYFHHKTRKKAFRFGIPAILLVQLLLVLFLYATSPEIIFL